jgi:hypothetical protein
MLWTDTECRLSNTRPVSVTLTWGVAIQSLRSANRLIMANTVVKLFKNNQRLKNWFKQYFVKCQKSKKVIERT